MYLFLNQRVLRSILAVMVFCEVVTCSQGGILSRAMLTSLHTHTHTHERLHANTDRAVGLPLCQVFVDLNPSLSLRLPPHKAQSRHSFTLNLILISGLELLKRSVFISEGALARRSFKHLNSYFFNPFG